MASEIRVNKITHTAGVGTITTSADGIVVAGIVTANNFSGNLTGAVTGSGANLTSLPAGQLTGTVADARLSTVSSSKLSGALPALDGSALTGVGVGTADSINTSGIITATAFAPTEGQLSHRNLIINGDMSVAQRGTTYTGADTYNTIDRFKVMHTGLNEDVTSSQIEISSGTTPYSLGFRKAFRMTNGNQSAGADNSDYLSFQYRIEAQDLASCGWDYKSTSSNITLSFWVKSSVSQNFGCFIRTHDGSQMTFPFETGTLTADTWTKITRTIPGNGSIGFSNDNGTGMEINISQWWGTNYTASGKTLDAWSSYDNASRLKDFPASTWYTTNDATFELTGVQLEVGPVATPFEFLSFAENKRRCGRYCQRSRFSTFTLVGTPGTYYFSRTSVPLTVPMRAAVTGTIKQATWLSNRYFAYKTWSSQTNVTTLTSASFASSHMGGSSASLDDNSKTDVNSVNVSMTVASGSSNAPLPANGPGSNNIFPIEVYDCLLEAEL